MSHSARPALPPWLPLLLGFLTAIGPLSTDMYLPAFTAIEAELHLPRGSAELTLATWFLGLSVGQLAQGTLSDRFGRRGPLLAGLAIYTLGSIGCALATDLGWLATWRCVAAFGGSASMVLPRAVVRDVSEGLAAARLMSRLMLIMGAAPILAPSLGGLMLQAGSWRWIFWFASVYGVLSALLVWLWLPETLPAARRVRLGLGGLLRQYAEVARDGNFRAHVAMAGFGMFVVFGYVGGGPGVFVAHFGMSPGEFAVLFGLNASTFIIASQFNPPLLQRFGAMRVMQGAAIVMMVSTLCILAIAVIGRGGPWVLFIPVIPAMASCAMIMPNAAVGALARHGMRAGSASALMGTVQFGLAALSGVILGWIADGTPKPMAMLMVAGALGILIAERFRTR
jgi:DHA1 family bicyclomycin/chloramphenicol resistance-like MFS transporter